LYTTRWDLTPLPASLGSLSGARENRINSKRVPQGP
jgi:hypothetical protein